MANTSTFSPRVIGVWYAGRWVSGAPAAGLNAVLSCPTKIRCRILGPGQYWIGRQRPGVPCRVSAAAVREIPDVRSAGDQGCDRMPVSQPPGQTRSLTIFNCGSY
jgi:hypothetical protein